MMRIELLICLFSVGMLGATLAAIHPQRNRQRVSADSGAISGRVLNAEGQPVPRATVYAAKTDRVLGKLDSAYTNSRGEFLIERLAPGTYTVVGAKEEDGYPPTDSVFHSVGPVDEPQITVYAQQVTPEVVIQLSPKRARLAGRIVDAITNEPVVEAQMTLSRIDNPEYTYSRGPNLKGEFNVLVPSVPFTVKVSAAEYEDWYYPGGVSKEHTRPLRLAQNATKELTIFLRPVNQR